MIHEEADTDDAGTQRDRPVQFGLKALLLMVATCAAMFGAIRVLGAATAWALVPPAGIAIGVWCFVFASRTRAVIYGCLGILLFVFLTPVIGRWVWDSHVTAHPDPARPKTTDARPGRTMDRGTKPGDNPDASRPEMQHEKRNHASPGN